MVQFTPTLLQSRTKDPGWDGNMQLDSLSSAPVLSVIGRTSVMVSN